MLPLYSIVDLDAFEHDPIVEDILRSSGLHVDDDDDASDCPSLESLDMSLDSDDSSVWRRPYLLQTTCSTSRSQPIYFGCKNAWHISN